MSNDVLVKIWHDGKLRWKPRVMYQGGLSSVVQIEVDKMSFFELADYVIKNASYTSKDQFVMYYLIPGKKLVDGLVLLQNDSDVNVMMQALGDDIKHMLHLYVEEAAKTIAQTGAQTIAQTGTPTTTQTSPIKNPTGATTSTLKFTKATAARLPQSPRTTPVDDVSDDDDSLDEDYLESEEQEFGSGADTEDEEWQECVQNTQRFNKEFQLSNQEIVSKVVDDEAHLEVEAESSYEDSDGYVNSPGQSEDDDIRGKKYTLETPIVTDYTDWLKWNWVVGTRFESRDSFKTALRNYAVHNGRNLKISTSNKNKLGRIGVSCVKSCPFKLYLSYHKRKECYMVKTVVDEHTCQRNMARNRQLSQHFLADTFLPIFNTKPHWTAKEIQDAVKDKFKVIINKWLAYNARKVAHKKLHGSMKEHYSKIGSYIQALRNCNPTSTFELLTVPSTYFGSELGPEVFLRLFICFDGVKRGFLSSCRKLLCLDGCFLKTFLGGMLLAAIGRDANDQMYPVAWAVVEGENTDSWTWFTNELKKCLEVSNDGEGWTLISDQQKGLLNAVVSVWEKAEHRNCARHIYANWNKKHKGEALKLCFWKTDKAYCEPDYNQGIQEMKEMSSDAAVDFLKQDPKVFSRCYLDTQTKTDVVVNNMAETFNGFIVQSRSKHIINMLEDIRVAIMTRLTKMQTTMAAKSVMIYPRIQAKLEKEKNKAYRCEVFPSSTTVFQVKHLDDMSVDMENRTCTCRKWDLTGIPCFHACAVVGFLGKNAEDYVHNQFTKEMYLKAYEFSIPPLPSQKYWPTVDMPLDPPPIRSAPGRPNKNRRRDPHEDPKRLGKLSKHGGTITCSICKVKGHNKRKCTKKGKKAEKPTKKSKKSAAETSGTQEQKGATKGRKRKTMAKRSPSKKPTKKSKNAAVETVSGTQQSTVLSLA